ncbi:transporter substrate-binding domain-containing protein [Ferrimonas lipolytica]|uniref:Transporter substrate-binding domain-containing protein n=1 Tax=Ferrimonas lipolytica TaxID=2724191 RepID=A0A6H1UH71_9GAMM|nr:transporter substrate-binding domain-containing protein [Ferrimonas lipolytica]QIZ77142.1 transporter substrate-binding domain-containing protein [Ferrimonas lipolytica]
MKTIFTHHYLVRFLVGVLFMGTINTHARDLDEIIEAGQLRHIGIPYANFVSYYDDDSQQILEGLDVELMKGFAAHLGIDYHYVNATWQNAFGKLTGQEALFVGGKLSRGANVVIEGDVIANGLTVLDWRYGVLDYSDSYFPSAVWLVARADSDLQPVQPSGSIVTDVSAVKALLQNKDVLAMRQSCLDPDLYDLDATGANVILPVKQRKLNEMVPAIMNNDAETTLLDVADTLVALEKWPGEIKVVGPISLEQEMAMGFRKNSPKLRHAFNQYLAKIRADGSFHQLVKKHYPSVFYFYSDYFLKNGAS